MASEATMATKPTYRSVQPAAQQVPSSTSISTLADFSTSKQRMDLFSNNQLGANPPSASPYTPYTPYTPATAVTDASWDDSTPPPYDIAVGQVNLKSPERAVVPARGSIRRMEGRESLKSSNGSTKPRRAPSRKQSARTPKSYSRPFRPGITVDTRVTRHHGDAPQQVFPNAQPFAQPNFPRSTAERKARQGGWVRRLSPLKRTRGGGSIKNDAGNQPFGQELRSNPASSATRRYDDTADDITPSDSHIPIGLFAPSEQTSISNHLNAPPSANVASASTPTIRITPAQGNMGWSIPQYNQNTYKPPRPRPASSIYSQATPTWRAPQPGETPPMPPLPVGIGTQPWWTSQQTTVPNAAQGQINARDSTTTEFEEQEIDRRYHDRTMSAGTIFEEDRTPESAQSFKQRYARRANDLEIDTTLPTPRRSRGWWNVITTPFESSRPGTRIFRSPTEENQHTPEVPDIGEAVSRYEAARNGNNHDPVGVALPSQPYAERAFNAPPSEVGGQSRGAAESTDGSETRMFIHLSESSPSKPHRTLERHDSQHETKSSTTRRLSFVGQQETLHVKNDSKGSVFSPNDREVPLVLDDAPEPKSKAEEKTFDQAQPKEDHDSHIEAHNTYNFFFGRPESILRVQSPPSATETPVVEIASMGTVHSAKTVEHTPALSLKSFQMNAPAPQQNLPLRGPATRQVNYYQYGQPGIPATMASRPMTNFPGPPTYAKRDTDRMVFPPPPIDTNVRSVWEKDEPSSRAHAHKHKKRGCCGTKNSKHSKTRKEKKKKRRCLLCCICLGFLVLVAGIVTLAVVLTRKHPNSGGTSQVQWLNLTGFPPMPTGEMTVAQPTLLAKVDGCAYPTTMWSCDLPKEDQQANLPAGPDEPSFRLEIRFSNDTISKKTGTQSSRLKRDLGGSPFTPSPSPPSEEDQIFLGNTTDHNSEPFQGENTPFFISFLSDAENGLNRKVKRSTPTSTSEATPTANFGTAIPSPSILDDGTAAPANLLPSPLPSSQPLMLYNRGQDNEHYGFYTYFSRTIFLKSVKITNINETQPGQIDADQNGGSTKHGAVATCTWTQTRFLVQIWTRAGQGQLLSASTNTSSKGSDNIANNFARPGSFPYPITITTDRHGGTPSGKEIFCYALDEDSRPVPLNKTLYLEIRDFQGTLVNPARGPFENVTIDPKDGGPGGMDGGSGGCGCKWGNWDGSRTF